MENFLLLIIFSILLLYFFSSANVYKSLYKKINEEKQLINDEIIKLQSIIKRYEKQVKIGVNAVKQNQDNLKVARNDLQDLKLDNNSLNKEIDILESRIEELYEQVNTMV